MWCGGEGMNGRYGGGTASVGSGVLLALALSVLPIGLPVRPPCNWLRAEKPKKRVPETLRNDRDAAAHSMAVIADS